MKALTEHQQRHYTLNKEEEQRVLRTIRLLEGDEKLGVNKRWAAIAKTHFEEGFMALNRAIADGSPEE